MEKCLLSGMAAAAHIRFSLSVMKDRLYLIHNELITLL